MFSKALLFGTLFISAFGFVFPQQNEKNVAVINSKLISADEFLERYEFTPGFRRNDTRFTESSKLEFLYTLIAEKLWALEAVNLGLEKSEVIEFSKKEFEKMFIRDELYHREILDKISFTEEELKEARRRNAITLMVNFLFSEDEDEIFDLYNLMNKGVSFDTILAESPEIEEQFVPLEIVHGQMEEHVEDSLYNLELGEYTAPIFTPDGWYIFRLTNKSEQLFTSISENEELNNSAEKILKARKEKELYWEFRRKFFGSKKIDVVPELFEELARNIFYIFKMKKELQTDKDLIYLLADDVINLEEKIVEYLDKDFILFEVNPLSLKQFIRIIAFDGFNAEKIELADVRKLLDSKTRTVIEKELLSREAYEEGLQYLPEIQKRVNLWVDNYLFQDLQNKFLDSVSITDDEVYQYYLKKNKEETYPVLVNLLQVFSDDIQLLRSLYSKLSDDKNYYDVIENFEEFNPSIKTSETGIIPISSANEIVSLPDSFSVGDIFGPEEYGDKFQLVIVTKKEKEKTVPPKSFDLVKDAYKFELARSKAKTMINNYTTKLALKYGFEINFDILESIEVTNISSFGIRHLGFGGKVTAVPLLSPNINWVEPYYEKLKSNP